MQDAHFKTQSTLQIEHCLPHWNEFPTVS